MIYQTKVDKLTINNTKSDCQSYVYMAPGEQSSTTGLGQLFIIVEIKSREKKLPTILNQIVEELSEYYYHSPTKNTEAALETTCQYFNENILDITGKNLKWIRDKVGILIAAIQENKLILSNYNNIRVWLLRDNKIHDITGGQPEEKKDTLGKKILSQLIAGQLVNDDVLLLTNATIFDYFSDEKIKKTISTLAPTQACAFFKNTLHDYKIPIDFSTMIVKFNSFKKETKVIAEMAKSDVLGVDKEIEQLNKEEPKILAKIIMGMGTWVKNILNQLELKIKGRIKPKIKLEKKTREEVQRETEEPKETGEVATGLIQPLGKVQTKKSEFWLKFKKWRSLNIVEYRLVILILIIGILFVGSLVLINNKKEKQQTKEEFQQLVNGINDKINSMEAALIYKDENRARELLAEARDLLNSLPKENAEQQYTYQELNKSIEGQVNKIYKLEKIENPAVIAFLPEGVSPTSNIYIAPDNIIYLARGGEIYKVNSQNQSIDKLADIKAQVIKILRFETNRTLLYASQNEIWLMDNSNYSTRKISFSLPDAQSKIKDIDVYAQSLYVLDDGKNNIYKYSYQTSSFNNAGVWLKQDEDITGNISLAVDGNVWLSAKGGKISKFFKGKKEVFSLKGEYEPISEQVILLTDENLDNLYLLDKEKNRILMADKQGKVVRQFLGDGIGQMISVLPNNNEDELYIMTAEKIYKIKL